MNEQRQIALNRISIKASEWVAEAKRCKAAGEPFEVHDVCSGEEIRALLEFANRENIFFLKNGDTVWFQPSRPVLRQFELARP